MKGLVSTIYVRPQIKPDGTIVWLTRQDELFLHSLAGLGQVGFIDAVSLSTVRHKRFTRLHQFRCRDLDDVVEVVDHLRDDYASNGNGLDFFVAMKSQSAPPGDPWRVRLGADYADEKLASSHDRDFPSYFYRRFPNDPLATIEDFTLLVHASMVGQVLALRNLRMIWSDFLFDFHGFCRFAAFVKESIIVKGGVKTYQRGGAKLYH